MAWNRGKAGEVCRRLVVKLLRSGKKPEETARLVGLSQNAVSRIMYVARHCLKMGFIKAKKILRTSSQIGRKPQGGLESISSLLTQIEHSSIMPRHY
jgi:predicted transcriptional regulator